MQRPQCDRRPNWTNTQWLKNLEWKHTLCVAGLLSEVQGCSNSVCLACAHVDLCTLSLSGVCTGAGQGAHVGMRAKGKISEQNGENNTWISTTGDCHGRGVGWSCPSVIIAAKVILAQMALWFRTFGTGRPSSAHLSRYGNDSCDSLHNEALLLSRVPRSSLDVHVGLLPLRQTDGPLHFANFDSTCRRWSLLVRLFSCCRGLHQCAALHRATSATRSSQSFASPPSGVLSRETRGCSRRGCLLGHLCVRMCVYGPRRDGRL